jgi:hypothetical protein
MSRTNRLAVLAALVLLVLAAGTVLGVARVPATSQAPAGPQADEHEADEPGTEDEVEDADDLDGAAKARERLQDAEIPVAEEFDALVERYGVGGAVRLSAWADATGMTAGQLQEMRDAGGENGEPMGWGRMARELGVHPGIGSIMGGGNAPDSPPGLERRQDD